MPVMDGFTFLEHFRRDPRFGRVPVVVATARTLSDDERRTLETTVQRVIEKTNRAAAPISRRHRRRDPSESSDAARKA